MTDKSDSVSRELNSISECDQPKVDDAEKVDNQSSANKDQAIEKNSSSDSERPSQPSIEGTTHDAAQKSLGKVINNTLTSSSSSSNIQQYQTQTHSGNDKELAKLKRDLENMVLKYAKSERENLINKNKVDELDKKLKRTTKDNDQLANRIKILTNDKNQLSDTLSAKVAQLTVLEQKNSILNSSQVNKVKECEEKIKELEGQNKSLLNQVELYKSQEGELLDFSERLSMKHMLLQTELEEAMKKVPSYKEEYELAMKKNEMLFSENQAIKKELESLTEKLSIEVGNSEQLKKVINDSEGKFRDNLDTLQNEIKVMKRKHQIVIKELLKEIRFLKSQLPGEANVHKLVGT